IHFGAPFEDSMKDALDYQLGIILALTEPPVEASKRRQIVFYGDHPYGQLGDIRIKRWGFEYRTPSSFIVTPGITLGIISIAKAIIWEELLQGPQSFCRLKNSVRQALTFNGADFYQCRREVFLSKLQALRNQLYKMLYLQK